MTAEDELKKLAEKDASIKVEPAKKSSPAAKPATISKPIQKVEPKPAAAPATKTPVVVPKKAVAPLTPTAPKTAVPLPIHDPAAPLMPVPEPKKELPLTPASSTADLTSMAPVTKSVANKPTVMPLAPGMALEKPVDPAAPLDKPIIPGATTKPVGAAPTTPELTPAGEPISGVAIVGAPTAGMETQASDLDAPTGPKKTSILAIVAMVLAVIFPLVGLVLGLAARVRIKKDPSLKGEKLALASIGVAGVLLLLSIVIIIYALIASPV